MRSASRSNIGIPSSSSATIRAPDKASPFAPTRRNSRALRSACDEASPTVVQARLTELREAGLIELVQGDGYRLTELGKDLRETVLPLRRFAERWSKQLAG